MGMFPFDYHSLSSNIDTDLPELCPYSCDDKALTGHTYTHLAFQGTKHFEPLAAMANSSRLPVKSIKVYSCAVVCIAR